MKSIQDIIVNNFERFDDLYKKLSDIFDINKNNSKILIAVSGGPDSMLLSVLIYNFFVKNNLNLDNLFFVHCNHKTRPETAIEQKFVEEFFDKLNLSVCVYNDGDIAISKTEKNLRDWRYQEFQKIIDQNKINLLLTGHNLTDRIESSFMNMFRGAGLNGFTSMKFVDQNNLLS
jgi:tRNA(Ile)-lysidine synthase